MFDLIEKVGGVHERGSEARDGVFGEKLVNVATDEIGTAQAAGLYGKTFGLEPLLQERDLRGTAGTVHALDDDEAAGDFVGIETDERFTEKRLRRVFFRLSGSRLCGDWRLRLGSSGRFFFFKLFRFVFFGFRFFRFFRFRFFWLGHFIRPRLRGGQNPSVRFWKRRWRASAFAAC